MIGIVLTILIFIYIIDSIVRLIIRHRKNIVYMPDLGKEEDIAKYREKVKGKSAVLANAYTASAAELFTCALMDYGISEIVGTTTYGKGSMQTIFSLEYFGFDGAVWSNPLAWIGAAIYLVITFFVQVNKLINEK